MVALNYNTTKTRVKPKVVIYFVQDIIKILKLLKCYKKCKILMYS